MSVGLSDEEIEDRFYLLGRMEILRLLNDLIHRREPVTVNFNGGRESLLTILLEARPEALIFDLGGDDRANQNLPKSRNCIFVARPDGIRVQFSGGKPNRFSWGDRDAFWIPLPERVVRMQRRESFRILLPVAKPLTVRLLGEGGENWGEWPVHDLSVGGAGINVLGEQGMEPGMTIPRLVLFLPNHGAVDCAALVRHVSRLAGSDFNSTRYRVGVAFQGLPRSMEVAIQRCIIDIEHERRRLAAG